MRTFEWFAALYGGDATCPLEWAGGASMAADELPRSRGHLIPFERECPGIEVFHAEDYTLSQPWLQHAKPSAVTLPTEKVDPTARARLRAAWNQPIRWPAALTVFGGTRYTDCMAIHLGKEVEAEITAKMRSGRYRSANAVIREGLALIEAREALRKAVREGEAQLARGEVITRSQSRRRIKRLAASLQNAR